MNNDSARNLAELSVHLSKCRLASAYSVSLDAIATHKRARQLEALAVCECNHGLSPLQEKREERLRVEIAKILKPYGLTAKFSGDPRGYVVKIQGLPGNTWGGDDEGFGVG